MAYLSIVVVFVCGEIVAIVVFPILERFLGPTKSARLNVPAILKGILERLVLFTALVHGYPQMLIAFAAFKLGTRLHHEEGGDISNTYFLVGNLVSIFLAIVCATVATSL